MVRDEVVMMCWENLEEVLEESLSEKQTCSKTPVLLTPALVTR